MGLLDWLTSAERTQQMQGFGNNLKGAIDNLKQSRGLLNAAVMEDIASMKSGNGFAANTPTQMRLDQMISNGVVNSIGPLMTKGVGKFVYPQEQALLTAQKNAALPIEKGGLGLPANNTPMDRARAMGMEDVFHGSKSPEGIDNLVAGGREGAIRHGDAYGTGVYTTTDAVGDASSYGAGGAVFPLKLDRGNHLQIDAPNANDLQKLSKFSGDAMLPSDKARFSIGRETRQFKDVQDARDFFANQRENWKQFGDGMDRAKPEAIANPDGTFAVQFTNFDAPVPITNGKEADTMFRALGYDNIPSIGYSGHTLDRGAGRLWDITSDTSKLRSRFAAFDPLRRHEADLLAGAIPFSVMVDQKENLGLGR